MKELSIEYPESILAVLNLSTESFEQEAKMAPGALLLEGSHPRWSHDSSPRVVWVGN